jgi:hypothetical protein
MGALLPDVGLEAQLGPQTGGGKPRIPQLVFPPVALGG